MGRSVPKRVVAWIAGALAVGQLSTLSLTAAQAAWRSTAASAGATFTTKRIFPGARTTSGWDLRDASSGAESNQSDVSAFSGDARTYTSPNLPTNFSAYIQLDFEAPLPGGRPVTGATFNFTCSASGGGGGVGQFYFEVRSISTNAVLATHGSSGGPFACGSTQTAIGEVATTDTANDLRIRVYLVNTLAKAVVVDLATVSGTSPYAFTLYEKTGTDATGGTPQVAPWSLYAGDGVAYTSAANWQSSFSTGRYLKVTVPGEVPAGAVLTGVSLTHLFNSASAGTTCYYLEVYSGTTLLGTPITSSAPSCSSSVSSFQRDVVGLTGMVTTVAQADSLVLKLYVRNSSSSKSRHDQINVAFSYYLN